MPVTSVTINANTFTNCGTTPCTLQMQGGGAIRVITDTSAPANNATSFLVTDMTGRMLKLDQASQNVYVKAVRADTTTILVMR